MRTKESRYAVELNEEQLEAVHAPVDKPIVVLAGPGSGKTAVIAARYARLVDIAEIKPSNIIAVTFTAQMAGSLLERIKALPGAYDSQGISTIHAFALRQLKALGIITNQQKAKDWTIRKEVEDYLRLNGWDKSPGSVRWWIDRSKIDGVAQNEDDLFAYYKAALGLKSTFDADRLTACTMRVHNMLKSSRTWTFPDLVNDLWQLTGRYEILRKMQEKIKYILIDEGQDTFELAVKLLRRICPDAFFIVGDQDQMLFRFTGASPETNLFQVAEEGILFKLSKNYRSTRAIVHAANNLITNNYTTETEKFMKKMSAVTGGVSMVAEPRLFSGPTEEAEAVVKTIVDFDYSPGEVFVGARTNAQLAYVEAALVSAKIPYVVLGTNGFFAQVHVKRVVDFLKKLEDPSYDAGGSDADTAWLKSFPSTARVMYGATPLIIVDKSVTAYLAYHRKKFGLVNVDAGQDDNIQDDLRTLIDISTKFDTLHSFLEFVRSIEQAEWMKDESGVVVLSTIHKLKGAERDIVFGIGWSEGLLPHNRAMSGPSNGDLPIKMMGTVNDERCAAFVLVTRARKQVFISSISSYRDVDLEPSRFVEEMMG